MKTPTKIIGILGGSGSAATANFFSDIVDTAQSVYGAEQDTDFPRAYLYNAPLEGFDETGFANPELVKQQLVADVKKLESWGADFIVMPCNTIHHFIKDMREGIQIPIISIIETTVSEVVNKGYTKVGILSSTSTHNLRLYEDALSAKGVTPILANDTEQKELDSVILAVMAGKQGTAEREMMQDAITRMKGEGAEAIILGCTELPLAITQEGIDTPLLNTIHLLAEAAVKESYT